MKHLSDDNIIVNNPFLNLDRSLFKNAEKNKKENIIIRPQPNKKKKKQEQKLAIEDAINFPALINNCDEHDEAYIFYEAMDKVKPVVSKGRDIVKLAMPKPSLPNKALGIEDFLDNSKFEFAEFHKGEYMEGHVVGLDALIVQKLKSGAYSIEANLDLHGLNAMQAFIALREFLKSAWQKGVHNVLVVTGRGHNSPQGAGVLRDKMHLWLTMEPLKRIVLAFCTAKPADGGPGSIYILLRSYKKKGKILWDRMPPDSDLL